MGVLGSSFTGKYPRPGGQHGVTSCNAAPHLSSRGADKPGGGAVVHAQVIRDGLEGVSGEAVATRDEAILA